MSIPSKPTYRFNPIPIKILARLSVNIGKFILKFIWKGKGTKMAKIILKTFRKKKKRERERKSLGCRSRKEILRLHKSKADKLGFIKIKNFCSAKDPFMRMKTQAIDWKKLCTNFHNSRVKHRNTIRKWAKDMNKYITEEIHR